MLMYKCNIFLISILLIIVLYSLKRVDINHCKWKPYKNVSISLKSLQICQERINVLKSLNLNYFLCFGSELGAVRETNLIKNDKDIDICVPIWMNYNVFQCNTVTFINTKDYINLYMDDSFLLCNKSRNDYYNLLELYIRNRIKNVIIRRANILLSIWYKNIYLDFYVMMNNEYIYRKINICICMFCDIYVKCLQNSIRNVKNYYGNNFLIPSHSVGLNRIKYNIYNKSIDDTIQYKFLYIK